MAEKRRAGIAQETLRRHREADALQQPGQEAALGLQQIAEEKTRHHRRQRGRHDQQRAHQAHAAQMRMQQQRDAHAEPELRESAQQSQQQRVLQRHPKGVTWKTMR